MTRPRVIVPKVDADCFKDNGKVWVCFLFMIQETLKLVSLPDRVVMLLIIARFF